MIRPAASVFLIAGLAAGLVWLKAQQTPAASDPAYASQPGGTSEENLWQVLILLGANDTQPTAWNGNLSIDGGDIHAPHRTVLSLRPAGPHAAARRLGSQNPVHQDSEELAGRG